VNDPDSSRQGKPFLPRVRPAWACACTTIHFRFIRLETIAYNLHFKIAVCCTKIKEIQNTCFICFVFFFVTGTVYSTGTVQKVKTLPLKILVKIKSLTW
jgi:hypothetical protein